MEPRVAQTDVDAILARLRAGDPLAADLVFSRFTHQLSRLVRVKLGVRYRQKFDTEDVVQSIYKSFFRLHAEGRFAFDTWDALWGLLSLIAVRKCGHRLDYLHARCRAVGSERSIVLDDVTLEGCRADLIAVSREPEPVHAAMTAEAVSVILAAATERDQQIIRLALEGATTSDISQASGRSERTVQRVLRRLEAALVRMAESIPSTGQRPSATVDTPAVGDHSDAAG